MTPRVCMLIARFRPFVGGAELQAERLSTALRAAGAGVFVLTARRGGAARRGRAEGVTVVRTFAPGPGPLSSACFVGSSLLHLLRHRREYDLIHVHLASSHALAALAARALRGAPVVVKLGGARETGDIGTSLRRPWGRWKLALVRRADRVIVPSAEVEAEALAHGFAPERLRRIPNGVDTGQFAPADPGERRAQRAALGMPGDATIGVYTGRLEPGKGLEELVEAWAGLGTDALLVLVGEGSLRAPLARRHRGARVRFAGLREDVRPYLRAADLFLLPSRGEGLSNALLEAMSCRLVPVVHPIPANEELVEDGRTGFLVDFGSPETAAAGLRRVAERSREWPAVGAAARREVEERFSMDRVRDECLALYAELLPHLDAGGGG